MEITQEQYGSAGIERGWRSMVVNGGVCRRVSGGGTRCTRGFAGSKNGVWEFRCSGIQIIRVPCMDSPRSGRFRSPEKGGPPSRGGWTDRYGCRGIGCSTVKSTVPMKATTPGRALGIVPGSQMSRSNGWPTEGIPPNLLPFRQTRLYSSGSSPSHSSTTHYSVNTP